ncbi:hypothetical protein TIFTF001_017786 [Ficus carica]|uniref:Uncharacterized protein n=1 Tax=Ficus carica TaxID=3494 RepID=A0AA88D8P0_FICCA|nr:hypothetical protein TIFTF001_017786 [Ficus carica]
MRVKSSGEYKNPSFRIIGIMILAAILELCAKNGIDRETMDEENTAPTVDQHNSFKASCTLNEKELGVSDQQPTPNVIHGIPLGEENVRVTVTVPKLKHALLSILTNETTIVEEAISGFAAWPYLVECCAKEGVDRWFGFISPTFVSPVKQKVDPKVYLIDPWYDSVMYFNPLGNKLGDDFEDLIKLALNDWKISGKRSKKVMQL